MADDRQIRKLINSKQDVMEFNGTPSKNSLSDGQLAITKSNNSQLAVYRKKFGKLWKSYMSYDGSQYVDRNIIVKNNIIYNGYLKNQHYPAFKAYISTSADDQAIADQTKVRITFDAESYDVGGNYDTSAYKFTAPIAGIYHFNAKVLWDNDKGSAGGDWDAGDRHDIYLIKNDSSTNPAANAREASELGVVVADIDDNFMMDSISGDLKLDDGDFIRLKIGKGGNIIDDR